ncbi:extracellular solute-binding protein [Paenibacillus pasadenensis]|uniref:extracellular solute-binding protein n=1 Tax=Paenibacillus pasadenensis TaxID=217090 RepID=UPI00203E7093|nr:extracellular solute-binding protein [Paenibacillus pasadenensis]
MQKTQRILGILLAGAIGLAGCSSSSSTTDGDKAVPISIYSFDRQNYGNQNDRVLDAIEKATGTLISLQTGGWEDTQLDILMATGSYPDVLTIVDNEKTGRFNKWIKEESIIPFTDELIEGLPNLQAHLQDPAYDELRINGELYGLPLRDELPQGSPGQHVLILRQDWLDKLGLPTPDTLQQFRDTLIAFRDRDPDGNGVHDTYGIIGNGLTSLVRNLMGAWGIPIDARSTGFLQVGTSYQYWVIQPEVKEAIKYVKELYDQQLIQPFTLSAATNVQVRPRFVEGRVGAMFDNANFEELIKKEEQLKRNFKDARLMEAAALAGPKGKRGYSVGSGFWGYTVITDKAKDPKAAARLLDYLLSDEGNRLTLYGLPDVHYKEDANRVSLRLDERKNDIGFGSLHPEAAHELNWGLVSWSRMTEKDYLKFRESSTPGFTKVVQDNLERINRYRIEPASYNLATPLWVSFKSTSDELTEAYFGKMIMGELDIEEGFSRFVDKWKESGGAEAMSEMSQALAKSAKTGAPE